MKNVKTFVHFVYIEKTTLTTENRSPVLHILFLLDIPTFNKLVIKNDPVKKATLFFVFMEGVQLPHGHALVLEELFTANFSVNFVVTANLTFW